MELIQTHLSQRPSEIVERFKFCQSVKHLDLDKAIEIASALKVAKKNARDVQKAQHSSHTTAMPVGVNQVMKKEKDISTPRSNGRSDVTVVMESTDRKTVDTGIKDVFPVENGTRISDV